VHASSSDTFAIHTLKTQQQRIAHFVAFPMAVVAFAKAVFSWDSPRLTFSCMVSHKQAFCFIELQSLPVKDIAMKALEYTRVMYTFIGL
jgi:hypothetical protein